MKYFLIIVFTLSFYGAKAQLKSSNETRGFITKVTIAYVEKTRDRLINEGHNSIVAESITMDGLEGHMLLLDGLDEESSYSLEALYDEISYQRSLMDLEYETFLSLLQSRKKLCESSKMDIVRAIIENDRKITAAKRLIKENKKLPEDEAIDKTKHKEKIVRLGLELEILKRKNLELRIFLEN